MLRLALLIAAREVDDLGAGCSRQLFQLYPAHVGDVDSHIESLGSDDPETRLASPGPDLAALTHVDLAHIDLHLLGNEKR
jgi:hypothetical protein